MNIQMVNRLIPGYGCCHWALVPEGQAGDAKVATLSREAYLNRASKRVISTASAA